MPMQRISATRPFPQGESMKIYTGILAAAFACAMVAGAQTTTTVVNSSTPGDRTVVHTTVGPDGNAATTATTITKVKNTRNVQTTHTAANGKTTTRDTLITRNKEDGTTEKLVVNGPKTETATAVSPVK
jgi:hypothetical protein